MRWIAKDTKLDESHECEGHRGANDKHSNY